MTEQIIRDLINENINPLIKVRDYNGNLDYPRKYFETSDKEWKEAVARVTQAIAQEKALANEPVRRRLPGGVLDPNSDIAMTPEKLNEWKTRNGYPRGGRHSRRHPRRHRGPRGGSSRMRSRGKRTSKKRNMRH